MTGSRSMWLTLGAMTLANSMILVDQTAVPLATPDVVHDLHAGCRTKALEASLHAAKRSEPWAHRLDRHPQGEPTGNRGERIQQVDWEPAAVFACDGRQALGQRERVGACRRPHAAKDG